MNNSSTTPCGTNPLGLKDKYTWQHGDTFALIACKYRRPDQWLQLLDCNKKVLQNNQYIMKEGDQIDIPPEWFPLPPLPERYVKILGSYGHAVDIGG